MCGVGRMAAPARRGAATLQASEDAGTSIRRRQPNPVVSSGADGRCRDSSERHRAPRTRRPAAGVRGHERTHQREPVPATCRRCSIDRDPHAESRQSATWWASASPPPRPGSTSGRRRSRSQKPSRPRWRVGALDATRSTAGDQFATGRRTAGAAATRTAGPDRRPADSSRCWNSWMSAEARLSPSGGGIKRHRRRTRRWWWRSGPRPRRPRGARSTPSDAAGRAAACYCDGGSRVGSSASLRRQALPGELGAAASSAARRPSARPGRSWVDESSSRTWIGGPAARLASTAEAGCS